MAAPYAVALPQSFRKKIDTLTVHSAM